MSNDRDIEMKIGGPIRLDRIGAFAAAVIKDRPLMYDVMGHPASDIKTVKWYIDSAISNQEYLWFGMHDASWGRLPQIESFCRDQKLSFLLFRAHTVSETPDIVFHDGESGTDRIFPCDGNWSPLMPVSELRARIDAGAAPEAILQEFEFPGLPPLSIATGHEAMARTRFGK